MRRWIVALAIGLCAAGVGAQDEAGLSAGGSCVTCHLELDEPGLREPAEVFAADAHNREGLGCVSCHGGDANSEEPDEAMDPARGFRGAPAARGIPALCGGCHGDSAFVRRFNPNLPTDQWDQYRTSVHGLQLAEGDTKVATCISCHGVHGIMAVSDPRSSVYPTQVVATCAGCHADSELMAVYGLSADPVSNYRKSIHFLALTEGNDLGAPTCNDCHGSHGATPPGVDSVSNVCGTCHPMNMELFVKSPHAEPFSAMELAACEACHGNHEILLPTDAWLGVDEESVCGRCHERDDSGGEVALALQALMDRGDDILHDARVEVDSAERAGMLMEESAVALEEAHQALVTARTQVHLASVAAVEEHTSVAVEAAESALAEAAAARGEIRFRRTGLLAALFFIVLAIVALVLKIRQLES